MTSEAVSPKSPEQTDRTGVGATPTATTDFFETSEGLQIFSRQAGLQNPGPPIIFLHGNRDNHSHYAELESLLSPKYHTVSMDFRGHGFSSKPDCPLTPEVFAGDLHEFITHYGWDQVILAGHSLGSIVSMVYALQHPERVSRLILMGSAAYYKAAWSRPEQPVTEETFPRFIEEANRRAGPFFFHEAHPDVQRRAIAVWSSVPFHVHKNLLNLIHPDLREEAPRLTMPTLVIAGEQDKSTTVEHARWIAENLPKAELYVVPDTAHFMYMERPDLVAQRIEQFLSESSGGA